MAIHIGTGPDSWGVWAPNTPGQVPWRQYLDEVVEAGYEWTESGPYGYLPTDVPTLRSELARRGLKISATTVMHGHLDDPADWPGLEARVLAAGELGAELDAGFMVLIDDAYLDLDTGVQVAPSRLDESGWRRLIDTTHKVADIARERFGLPVTFHPHADTHVQYEDEIEAFLEQTDPGRVSLVLDTGHHAYCGGDPVAFMRKHHSRVAYLHLKSVDGEVLERVNAEVTHMGRATAMGVFCEPSAGMIDFEAFGRVLRETGYDGLATVEQDMFRPPLDVPLPIARRTREYLREIGIG